MNRLKHVGICGVVVVLLVIAIERSHKSDTSVSSKIAPAKKAMTDLEISESIASSISHAGFADRDIEIRTVNGTVKISGDVADTAEKLKVENACKSVEGVRSFKSFLQVTSPSKVSADRQSGFPVLPQYPNSMMYWDADEADDAILQIQNGRIPAAEFLTRSHRYGYIPYADLYHLR